MRPKYLNFTDVMHCLRDKMQSDADESEKEHYRTGSTCPWDGGYIFNCNNTLLYVIERELKIELEKKDENYFTMNDLELYFNGTENEYLLTAFDGIESKIIDAKPENSPENKLQELQKKYDVLKNENEQIKRELDLKNKINFGFETKTLRTLAKAQKEFWPDSIETKPPVLRKTVMNSIIDELELNRDKHGESRKAQDWIKAIEPDSGLNKK